MDLHSLYKHNKKNKNVYYTFNDLIIEQTKQKIQLDKYKIKSKINLKIVISIKVIT